MAEKKKKQRRKKKTEPEPKPSANIKTDCNIHSHLLCILGLVLLLYYTIAFIACALFLITMLELNHSVLSSHGFLARNTFVAIGTKRCERC